MTKKLRNLLAGGLVLMCSVSLAQPILTASGMNPVIGESFTLKGSSYINPGSAGANQTWNLSLMSNVPQGLTTIVAPSSTAGGASFPSATIAWNNPTAGTVAYYKTSATALQNYGFVGGASVVPYSNPEDFLRFPFAFNNTYSDTWAGQFVSSGYTFYRKGTTTVTADGYGALITPTATHTNVMRVHFVQVYIDSSFVLGAPYVITYDNDEYIWYKEGIHLPIASVFKLNSSISAPYTGGTYVNGLAGIDNSSDLIRSSNLFPNPATDKVTVEFTLSERKNVDIRLTNALGQQLEINKNTNGIPGMNTIELDVANLPEGIYFAQILLEGNVAAAKRFVIGR